MINRDHQKDDYGDRRKVSCDLSEHGRILSGVAHG
jgi:hypothetical protein